MEEEILFKGHENIRGNHKNTIEVTKDDHLSLRGDCIIGIKANKACNDLSEQFKELIKREYKVKVAIIVDNYEYSFYAQGNRDLTLNHKHDIVIRKSNFICNRTLCIKSEKASIDIPREIISLLNDPNEQGILLLSIE